MQLSSRRWGWWAAAGLAAVTVLAVMTAAPAHSSARAVASSKPPRACASLFPSAHSTRLGKTLFYNRQASVQDVVCFHFGLDASADFPVTADVVCGMVSAVLGGPKKTAVLGSFTDGACSAASLKEDPKSPTRWIGAVCGWASDLLGYVTPGKVGSILGVGCTLAPSAGSALGNVFESKHEFDVATDIARHRKCLKYSPSHFGSPWLAVACARSDKGFSTLPKAGASYQTTRACRGILVDSNMAVLRTEGPVTVTMPYATAVMIARKIGVGEFGAPTTANDIPCDVGRYVAEQGLNSEVPSSRPSTVDGLWTGEAGSYDLGSFTCTANHPDLPYQDTCVHSADPAAGQVTVRFEVTSNVD